MHLLDSVLNPAYIEKPDLTEAEEHELIRLARSGCNESTLTLLTVYAPLIRNAFHKRDKSTDPDEVKGAILLGFVQALTDFDPDRHRRLAAVLPHNVRRQVSEVASDTGSFTIPERTYQRWVSITRQAGGSTARGMVLAPELGMPTSTYLDVLGALRATQSVEDVLTEYARPLHPIRCETPIAETDSKLVALVFSEKTGLTHKETEVLRHSYGWYSADGTPKTDDHVGHDLELSRPTVQRHRVKALDKGRRRLGLVC